MKLHLIHVFLLFVSVLVFSNLGISIKEGMKNRELKKKQQKKAHARAQSQAHTRAQAQEHTRAQRHVPPTYNANDFVTKDQIPAGDEHLYILKSKIVPPVCPKCPDVTVCPKAKNEKCPPCPPCGRCPVAPFECKKVPTYKSADQDYIPNFVDGALTNGMPHMMGSTTGAGMPMPMLNDFSEFS